MYDRRHALWHLFFSHDTRIQKSGRTRRLPVEAPRRHMFCCVERCLARDLPPIRTERDRTFMSSFFKVECSARPTIVSHLPPLALSLSLGPSAQMTLVLLLGSLSFSFLDSLGPGLRLRHERHQGDRSHGAASGCRRGKGAVRPTYIHEYDIVAAHG